MRRIADAPERLVAALAGRYVFERQLGRGGMATVYLARDVRHGRSVAIKVLHASVSHAAGTERFHREIRTVAGLQHPNIVPLFDSGEVEGCVYFVMPHVQGGSLRDRLRREKQLPIEDALAIATAVADALEYAHAQGIVHRDIKPENILFSGDRPMVADFGLARSLVTPGGFSLTREGTAIGTVAYMSPEQASGRDRVEARADQYGLACVLFEMLAGQPPFTGATDSAVLSRHATERPPSLLVVRPAIPRNVDAAVRKALAKVPADRYASMRDFARALGGVSGSRWSARVAAAVMLAIAATAAALLWRRSPAIDDPIADLNSVAVLYFDHASSDSLSWLASGLTEDLIDALSAVRGLTVTSRNGVRAYATSPASPDSVGRALDVGLIVDGTVRKMGRGDSVEVTVRLVDAERAVQLERIVVAHSATEPLALRRDVTAELELALRRRIGRHVRLRTERDAAQNDVAWESVQRAREIQGDGLMLGRLGKGEAALHTLARADSVLIAAERAAPEWNEPTLLRANVAIAAATVSVQTRAAEPSPSDLSAALDALERGLVLVERVRERDASNPRANAIRGELLYRFWEIGPARSDSLLNESLSALEAATRGDRAPPRAWYVLSYVLSAQGRRAESDVAARRALQEDVFAEEAASLTANLFFAALYEGRPAADTLCATGQRRYPTDPNFIECELTLLGWFGAGEADATRAGVLASQLDSNPAIAGGTIPRRLMVAAVLARSGRADEARDQIRAAHDLAGTASDVGSFAEPEAYVWLLLGDTARALQLLETVVTGDPSARPWLAAHPWFRDIAHEPRFRRIVAM